MATSDTSVGAVRIEDVEIGEETSRLSKAIFVILCLIPVLATIIFGGVDSGTWVLISGLASIMFLLWLGEEWNAGGFFFDTSVLQLAIVGLIVIGLIQLLPLGIDVSGGSLKYPASTSISVDPYATRLFIVHLVIYLVFLSACLIFINTEGRVRKITLLIVIFGAAMAFFGILQRLANPEAIYGLRETPQAIPFGPFVNQHHFAAFMQMTSGVTLSLLFGKAIKKDRKLLFLIAALLMGVATVLTGSRGGLLGYMAVISFVVLQSFISLRRRGRHGSANEVSAPPRTKFTIVIAGAALAFIVFGIVLLIGGGDSLLRGTGINIGTGQTDFSTGRTHFWFVALQIFMSHPILGTGLDAFGVAFTRFDSWNGTFRVEQAHNEYLQTLADAGIAGLLCIAGFIYFLFKRGLATIANTENVFRRDAAVGALAGCFGIIIHSFFDFPLRTPSNAFFFLVLCTIAVSAAGPVVRQSRQRRKTAGQASAL